MAILLPETGGRCATIIHDSLPRSLHPTAAGFTFLICFRITSHWSGRIFDPFGDGTLTAIGTRASFLTVTGTWGSTSMVIGRRIPPAIWVSADSTEAEILFPHWFGAVLFAGLPAWWCFGALAAAAT